jgi:hypothetical protein
MPVTFGISCTICGWLLVQGGVRVAQSLPRCRVEQHDGPPYPRARAAPGAKRRQAHHAAGGNVDVPRIELLVHGVK